MVLEFDIILNQMHIIVTIYLSNDKKIFSGNFLSNVVIKYFSNFFLVQIDLGAVDVAISIFK